MENVTTARPNEAEGTAAGIATSEPLKSQRPSEWLIWIGGFLTGLEYAGLVVMFCLFGTASSGMEYAGYGYLALAIGYVLVIAAIPIALVSVLMSWAYLAGAPDDDDRRGGAILVIMFQVIFCVICLFMFLQTV